MNKQGSLELVKPQDYTVAEIKNLIGYPGDALMVYRKLQGALIKPSGKRYIKGGFKAGVHTFSKEDVDLFINLINAGKISSKNDGNWKDVITLKATPKPPSSGTAANYLVPNFYSAMDLAIIADRPLSTVRHWLRELKIKPCEWDLKNQEPLYDITALNSIIKTSGERARRTSKAKSVTTKQKGLIQRLFNFFRGV